VTFFDLGLVVVDEQHRFGVEQRDALRGKGRTAPHVLVMTATPIPRTVAMTVFGDLEISTLDELPAGRVPIVTHVVGPVAERPGWLERVWTRSARGGGRRPPGYVVCPRIGGDDDPATPCPTASPPARPLVSRPGDVLPLLQSTRRSRGCGSRCSTAGCRPTPRTR
jgi:ATP-dependent DNA helicase RecG